MRNDERLRTIYEVMAPYIVRSERNWREYLSFASRFHKQSFDNILLVYAQDEDVTILATKKQWAGVGRNLISRPKGIAVCVYSNARLTLDYLFDVSQTVGREIHPTDWQLSAGMQKALGERLTFSHGFQTQPFPDLLYALVREAVNDNYEHYLQGLRQETKNHLFEEIPAGGFEAQYIQLLTDSVSYFIGKKCHLPDETIRMGDGMATVSHFNTVPLVAHLGMAVTSISKAVLLEMERNIRIINRERKVQHEQAEHQSELQGTGGDASPRTSDLQQQRGGQAPGPVRADGAGISQGQPAGAIYDFENGWQSDGDYAPGTGRGHREDRGPDPADASAGPDAADRGHSGADTPPERPEADGGGNGTPDHRADPPLTEEQPHTEAPQGAEHDGEPPAQDGSLSVSPKAEHQFSNEEVRRHYEHILTSTDLYPAELHQAVRAVLADGVTDYNWTEKGREICGLFTAYGDREFQGEVLYRTKLRGEDGISFYFDDGYTYFPWPRLANLLDALIETGAYPDVTAEEESDPIGDYNIPDEIEEMGGGVWREIGQADYDYVLGAVAYEAGETAEEPVRPQAVFTEIKGIPKADEIDAFVPEPVVGGQQVIVAGDQANLIPPAEESPSPHKSRGNTTAHKNFQRFQKLFPEIVSGQYESLRLEAGDAYDPLVIHHKYGDHYCMEHYYMQNGDRMYDPYMDFQIDTEAGTLRAFSYENSGVGIYQEADPADPAQEKKIAGFGQFFATWLNNIASQGYEPVCATMLVNDEEVDVELRPAPGAAPAAEAEEPEQLSLLASPPERSPEDLLIERILQKGPLTEGKKEQIYHFALTHPTGSAFVTFLKQLYGYEGFSSEELGVKYSLFNGDGITIEWEDTQGGPHETKLSWPQAAGIVQRLVDEERYLEAPAVSEPEQKDETQPFSAEYRLLDRLCADCEYFLGEGQRAEKHLWAGSVEAQIAKMRELYAQLPEKPDWLSPETIDAYARRMAAPEQPEETRILDEALDAHNGQIDMLMQAVRGELTVGTLRYNIFEGRPHISMIEVLEDYRRQGIATQMLRYLQGQYPDEEIEWGYLTEEGSALYRAVVDEQPNPEYQKVKTDLEDITHLYDGYVQRMEGGGILSPAEAADMDDLEDIQYRLEKELDELRPVRAFVRMEGVPPTQPEERTVTEPPANPRPEPFIPRNFRFSTDYDLYPGGAKTKYKNNILAIKTLKQIEAEQRAATPEEQITLARYVGWGGLANAFSDKAAGWESEYQELKALLTDEEYKAAMRDRFVRFYNLPELMAVLREVADIKTADMLDIPGLPAIQGGKAQIIPTEATPAQRAIMAEFILRADAIRAGRVKPEEDNMLKLTSEARMMAIDPRMIVPTADGTGSKLNICIDEVYQVWADTAAASSTQLIFCDVGTPKAGRFNVYDEFKRVLIEKGVPESQIAFIHDAATETQRQALFERTCKGEVRILLGSTNKLGTGVNVQDKVIAINHLDCPWRPSDITQRDGRGVRQGNENPEVMIKQFVTRGTFDAYLWQIQEQKLRYIKQILTGRSIARSCEDVDETVLSAAQFKAAATDNPMLAQKMELENRVTELKILRGAWSNEQLSLERKVNTTYPSHIKQHQRRIEQINQDIALLEQNKGGNFSIVLDGKRYAERPAAGEALALLYRTISESRGKEEYEFEIGAYRGFRLYFSFNPFSPGLILRGASQYSTDIGSSGQGAITRIENLAERVYIYLADAQRDLEETQKQFEAARQQMGQPFIYEEELSEKAAQLTEINTKLEFESLQSQESEVVLDEDNPQADGGKVAAGISVHAAAGIEQ